MEKRERSRKNGKEESGGGREELVANAIKFRINTKFLFFFDK